MITFQRGLGKHKAGETARFLALYNLQFRILNSLNVLYNQQFKKRKRKMSVDGKEQTGREAKLQPGSACLQHQSHPMALNPRLTNLDSAAIEDTHKKSSQPVLWLRCQVLWDVVRASQVLLVLLCPGGGSSVLGC